MQQIVLPPNQNERLSPGPAVNRTVRKKPQADYFYGRPIMGFYLAAWPKYAAASAAKAAALYERLCEDLPSVYDSVPERNGIDSFYRELTSLHPESMTSRKSNSTTPTSAPGVSRSIAPTDTLSCVQFGPKPTMSKKSEGWQRNMA